MNQKIFEKISDLLLFAIGFEKGDKLFLKLDFDQRETALVLSEKAYKGGASYVHFQYTDEILQAQAIAGSREEFWFPSFMQTTLEEAVTPGWKLIAIRSNAEGDVFQSLDPNRSTQYFKQLAELSKNRRKAVMENRIPWTLTYLPSPSMAKKAFPELPPEEGQKRYWDAVISIMRLDKDDPVAFWKEKIKKDKKRVDFMTNLGATHLHFEGPGTDLMVGLATSAEWIGGQDRTFDGKPFMANIPTDEIFTSPDWRQSEGKVSLTRPFVMHNNLGPIPRGVWFEFKEGKVVDFGAEEGKETLQAFFDLDDRARYLGEVALVDPESPFAKTGITYYNGLYDENAACHLALGKAYPFTLREQGNFSDEELLGKGLNISTQHEDMMVGGSKVNVTAILPDGSKKAIIENGKYLI